MAELADAADSKSAGLRPLGDRLPLPAPASIHPVFKRLRRHPMIVVQILPRLRSRRWRRTWACLPPTRRSSDLAARLASRENRAGFPSQVLSYSNVALYLFLRPRAHRESAVYISDEMDRKIGARDYMPMTFSSISLCVNRSRATFHGQNKRANVNQQVCVIRPDPHVLNDSHRPSQQLDSMTALASCFISGSAWHVPMARPQANGWP